MTPEELRAEMDRLGIKPGKWEPVGGREFEPAYVRRHKELLLKLKGVLDAQAKADARTIEQLEIAKAKMKHGGGR